MKSVTMAQKEKSPRQRAWKAMRILSRWTLGDLEATAEITRCNAESFVYALVKAGYVRCVQAKRNGVKGGYAKYQLIRNTGPRSPITTHYKSVIHDRNTGVDTIIGKPIGVAHLASHSQRTRGIKHVD